MMSLILQPERSVPTGPDPLPTNGVTPVQNKALGESCGPGPWQSPCRTLLENPAEQQSTLRTPLRNEFPLRANFVVVTVLW